MDKKLAYALGFLLGDSSIQNTGRISLRIQLRDKEIVHYIQNIIGGTIKYSYKKNLKKKIFPKAILYIQKSEFPEAKTLFGGLLKTKRRIPNIKKEFEPHLIRGFFDAKGIITWGYRKDRKRLWQKIAFHSQLKLLEGIQKILIKNNISSIIKPVKNSSHFIIEITNQKNILKLYNYIYQDLNNCNYYLKRKYNKFTNWYKIFLEELKIKPGDKVKVNKPINVRVLTKSNQKYIPLRIELDELLERYYNTQSAAKPSEMEGSETTGVCSDTK